ncbi:glycosyltransferase family 61 protein [Palleronia rufa]|uniref:glycosyltransferase family 61 protein n=1 Tax=Palleronia rufa TaxID=1530186 RepID=UPI000559E58B|nr:glycosyltransferase family 61 protein [Palleronia rufa]
MLDAFTVKARARAVGLCERGVRSGLPPGWFGWRWLREESLREYFASGGPGDLTVIHPEARASNPLPVNVDDPSRLSDDPDWFGYSQRDVPSRPSGETLRATVPDARIVSFTDSPRNRFWPTILNARDKAFEIREMRFRPGHGEVLRTARPRRIDRATWITERVFTNYSHWLSAHLPKLCLLAQRGEMDGLLIPETRSPVIDTSLRILGYDPADFATHSTDEVIEVGQLTLLETDRFRPELLRPVREMMGHVSDRAPWRRVFISRAAAAIRKLENEAELVPMLKTAGFELVAMEDLTFEEQIRLMGETAVLMAPHGAGLTNMMFCAPGTQVVEIAEPRYPNPNFYAIAVAMGLDYWKVDGAFAGDPGINRLDRDLMVDPATVEAVLKALG